MSHSRKTKGKKVDRGDDSDDNGDEMGRLIERLVAKALKKNLEKLKKRAHDSDSEDDSRATGHKAPETGRLAAAPAAAVSNEAIMAELSWMRAAITRMEKRQLAANASTPGASGSGSTLAGSNAVPAHAHAPDSSISDSPALGSSTPGASSIIPLPERKAMITITMIREYIGLPEDPKDSAKKDSDRRWYDIRAIIRDLMIKGEIDMTYPWKRQDKSKLGALYSMIRESVPEFRNFANNWGAEYLVQETFNHQRGHRMIARRKSQKIEGAQSTSGLAIPQPAVSPDSELVATPAPGAAASHFVDHHETLSLDGDEDEDGEEDELPNEDRAETSPEPSQPPSPTPSPSHPAPRRPTRAPDPPIAIPTTLPAATRSRTTGAAVTSAKEPAASKRKRNEQEEATALPKKKKAPVEDAVETTRQRMKKKGKGRESP